MSLNEYAVLENLAIKKINSKRFSGRYKEIVADINKLNEASDLCNRQKLTYSFVLHQVRFLKGTYNEELKNIIQNYHEIIFPDFTLKNDLNTMINGPYALKIWLLRYMCLKVVKCELSDLIDFEMKDLSVTLQYQKIDMALFNAFINVKVTNN